MKTKIYFSLSFSVVLLTVTTMSLVSCSSDSESEKDFSLSYNTYQMVWNSPRPSYEAQTTRADGERAWAINDVVYIRMIDDVNHLMRNAMATYAGDGTWNMSFAGRLTDINKGRAEVYFFDNVGRTSETSKEINLLADTPVYIDLNGSFEVFDSGRRLELNAFLVPEHGRIRFKGTSGQKIFVKGVQRHKQFSPVDGFTQSSFVDSLIVDNSGYTPYLYGKFAWDIHYIMVSYDDKSFYTEFPANDDVYNLENGVSAFMTIPTTTSLNGFYEVNVTEIEEWTGLTNNQQTFPMNFKNSDRLFFTYSVRPAKGNKLYAFVRCGTEQENVIGGFSSSALDTPVAYALTSSGDGALVVCLMEGDNGGLDGEVTISNLMLVQRK